MATAGTKASADTDTYQGSTPLKDHQAKTKVQEWVHNAHNGRQELLVGPSASTIQGALTPLSASERRMKAQSEIGLESERSPLELSSRPLSRISQVPTPKFEQTKAALDPLDTLNVSPRMEIRAKRQARTSFLEKMPNDDCVIKKGMMQKLGVGHVGGWMRREVMITEDTFLYSNEACDRIADSFPLIQIEKIVSLEDGSRHKGSKNTVSFGIARKFRWLMNYFRKIFLPKQPPPDHSSLTLKGKRDFFASAGPVSTRSIDRGEIKTGDLRANMDESNSVINLSCNEKPCNKPNTLEIHLTPDKDQEIGRVLFFEALDREDCLSWLKTLREASLEARECHINKTVTSWRRVQLNVAGLYTSDFLQFVIVSFIIANFVANVVEFEIMSKDDDEMALFDRIDIVFTTFFTLEFIVNMIAHIDFVPFPFLSSGWNVLDLVVVLVSLFSAATKAFLETEKNGNSKAFQDQNQSLKVLRILRAFRVVRVFKRLTALRLIIVALGASILPVLNTFFVLFVATAVFAILGVGLFSTRPSSSGAFGHFSEAFFTMFQCVSGDGWASNIARPMFEDAESTCTYRNAATGKCEFDATVATFFLSYILIVVIVVANVVLAVLIEEFLLAASKEKYERFMETHTSDGSASQYFSPIDPLLQYFAASYDSHELSGRIEEVFGLIDADRNGDLNFGEMRDGLYSLNLSPRIKITEEDWQIITLDGLLASDENTLSLDQFEHVIRNQITLYVQRMACKTMAMKEETGQQDTMHDANAFVLKYLVTAIQDLRSSMGVMQNMLSACQNRGSAAGGAGVGAGGSVSESNSCQLCKLGNNNRMTTGGGRREGESNSAYIMKNDRFSDSDSRDYTRTERPKQIGDLLSDCDVSICHGLPYRSREEFFFEDFVLTSQREVDMKLTLGIEFSLAGGEHSNERQVFVKDLVKDLALASGLSTANFHIMRLLPGSIIVDVWISAPDPLAVTRDLQRQANDPQSLLRSGSITRFTQAILVGTETSRKVPYIQDTFSTPTEDTCVRATASRNGIIPTGECGVSTHERDTANISMVSESNTPVTSAQSTYSHVVHPHEEQLRSDAEIEQRAGELYNLAFDKEVLLARQVHEKLLTAEKRTLELQLLRQVQVLKGLTGEKALERTLIQDHQHQPNQHPEPSRAQVGPGMNSGFSSFSRADTQRDESVTPPPWTLHVSIRNGKNFWYNTETKETTWTYPGTGGSQGEAYRPRTPEIDSPPSHLNMTPHSPQEGILQALADVNHESELTTTSTS